jgi:hypothetical protein
MKPSDFHIGLEFACGPFEWRCTDVGTRTVVAIRLVEDDPIWYEGPPYMVDEVVLDEDALEDAYPNQTEQIRARVKDAQNGHPGYPGDTIFKLMRDGRSGERYPRQRLLEFDRIRADGELLHPYGARRVGGDDSLWDIKIYLPFTQERIEIGELEFRALPLSTPEAVHSRAEKYRALK